MNLGGYGKLRIYELVFFFYHFTYLRVCRFSGRANRIESNYHWKRHSLEGISTSFKSIVYLHQCPIILKHFTNLKIMKQIRNWREKNIYKHGEKLQNS